MCVLNAEGRRKWILIFLILFLPVSVLTAQSEKYKSDTAYINSLNRQSDILITSDPDSARLLALQALNRSEKIKYLMGLGDAYMRLGKIEKENNNVDAALENYRKSLYYRKKLGDDLLVSRVYSNIGIIYKNMDAYDSAAYYHLKSIELAERVNAIPDLVKYLNNLGIVYIRNENYEKAREYQLKNLYYATLLGDTNSIDRAYVNLGSVYTHLGPTDSAIFYIRKILNNKSYAGTDRLASASNNAGQVYMDLEKPDSAIYYFNQAIEIWRKNSDPQLATPLSNLGILQYTAGNYEAALKNFLESNSIADQIGELKLQSDNFKYLGLVYAKLGRNNEAIDALQRSISINDSVFDVTRDKTVSELQTKYETAKTEQALIEERQKTIRMRIINISITGIAILLFIAGFLFISRRQLKRKLEFEQKLKNDRIRISGDLHDDIGSTLGSISYFSQLARMQHRQPDQDLDDILVKIEEVSYEAVEKMSDIVWAINPVNDNFEKLLVRMRNFAAGLLKAKNIEFELITDEHILPEMKIQVVVRKNLFLIFKESIYNASKYAECKKVTVSIGKVPAGIYMEIQDDGIGFDVEIASAYNGNGIRNMRKRAHEIKSEFTVRSGAGKGTNIRILVPSYMCSLI